MKQIKKYIKQLQSINVKGAEFYSFLLSNAQEFNCTSSDSGKEIADKYNIRVRSKACFYNAQQLTIYSDGKFKYYEGYAISKRVGLPFEHAWNVFDGNIVDLSWEDGVEYFGVNLPYKWIKSKFYEYAFKHNISESHLIRYWEEINKKKEVKNG